MKNKINESNNYECVLCETGEGERHGLQCSENKDNRDLGFSKQDILNLLAGINLLIEAENDTENYTDLVRKLKARI